MLLREDFVLKKAAKVIMTTSLVSIVNIAIRFNNELREVFRFEISTGFQS
jgi:hypothetical protein